MKGPQQEGTLLGRLLAFLAVWLAPALATAQPAQTESLDSGVVAARWEAIGRVQFSGGGFCTGVLIAEDLVLTAAHCLFEPDREGMIPLESLRFQAGWRQGRAAADRRIRAVAVHPGYKPSLVHDAAVLRRDIALLRLDHPIRNGRIVPLAVAAPPAAGSALALVSYAKGRAAAPSLQSVCALLDVEREILVTSCDVDFGASGAPILTIEDGTPRVVAIVSAKAQMRGRSVSIGMELGPAVAALRQQLANRPSALSGATLNNWRHDTRRNSNLGAKFLKP